MSNPLINYDDSPENETWTARTFKKFFEQKYREEHKGVGGALPWGLREDALLKRMRSEFKDDELAKMITYWHSHEKAQYACSFLGFYAARVTIYHRMQPKEDYSWD